MQYNQWKDDTNMTGQSGRSRGYKNHVQTTKTRFNHRNHGMGMFDIDSGYYL